MRLSHWRYLGYDKKTLQQYEAQIARENLKILPSALAVALGITLLELILAMALLFAGSESAKSLVNTVYLLVLTLLGIGGVGVAYLAVRTRENQQFHARLLTTVFLGGWSLLYVIFGTVLNPNGYAVMACGLFMLVQVVFDAYPVENLLFASCAYAVFLAMSAACKSVDLFCYDVLDTLPFLLLGNLLSWMKSRSKWSALINADAKVQLEKQRMENELTNARISIMLSQIQPHFLYNVLSTIQWLCHKEPAMAEKAAEELSLFLRGNMDSLSIRAPIAFSAELEHTKHYLTLEKMRFADQLTLAYDIQTVAFSLPTLTLQPIVENAVRYGVTKREDGGTVKISTRETEQAFVITVADDGVGFDPYEPHEDGRTHIGIQNVRDRLHHMCGGTLEISSVRDVGTIAVITIPKGA